MKIILSVYDTKGKWLAGDASGKATSTFAPLKPQATGQKAQYGPTLIQGYIGRKGTDSNSPAMAIPGTSGGDRRQTSTSLGSPKLVCEFIGFSFMRPRLHWTLMILFVLLAPK